MANLYRDEFIFEGVVYDFRWALEAMQYFRDKLTFRQDDILVATFGKSGK